ncbi:hypothetical protein ACFQVA_14795 [Actinomadura keratinilytica]
MAAAALALALTGLTGQASAAGREPMPADPTLADLTFLTAHNAMHNTEDQGRSTLAAPNQPHRIARQLDDGVRALMLDAHHADGRVRMCHAIPVLNPCGSNADAATVFTAIADFLDRDREAAVTVFLEDYTTADQLTAELGPLLAPDGRLGSKVFRPDAAGVRENGWPTVSSLREAGRAPPLHRRHRRLRPRPRQEPPRLHGAEGLDGGELLVHGRRHRRRRLVLLQPLGRRAAHPRGTRLPPPLRHEPLPRRPHVPDLPQRQRQTPGPRREPLPPGRRQEAQLPRRRPVRRRQPDVRRRRPEHLHVPLIRTHQVVSTSTQAAAPRP